jgi:hypothetical protein
MSLFTRVRGRLSISSKLDSTDPHHWRLPSSYSISRSNSGRQTTIPNPRIFRNAFVPNDPTLGIAEASLIYPDISHVAVHLALLECFRKLRLSASGLDVEVHVLPDYSENPAPARDDGPIRLPDSDRWDLLIRLAATRFVAWWMNIDQVFNHATAYTHHAGNKSVVQLTKDYLPPLDVLLVWYAFMLDHEDYDAACRDRDMPKLLELCFPWPAIRDVIDFESMTFSLPRAADNLFNTLTGQSADILKYLSQPPAYMPATSLLWQTNLFSEVKSQDTFIDNAHDLLWIRSPSLKGSLDRSAVNYLEMQLSKGLGDLGETSLPFGVELTLRTHKLFPIQYQIFCKDILSTNVPADSKSPVSPQLTTSGEESQGNNLSTECCCWTCERVRDDLPEFTYDKSNPTENDLSLLSQLSSAKLHSIQDDLGFYRAVENARIMRLPLPVRPPTAEEKEAEKVEAKKRHEAGVLPGLNEYVVVLPNGKRKIKRSKYFSPTFGLSMV